LEIFFHTEDIDFAFDNQSLISEWITKTFLLEKLTFDTVNIIFCSDDYLLNINKEFLKRDYLTDVITFDYTEAKIISGDIFISIDRVRENAVTYGQPFTSELHRIIIHGVLHLIGYNDQSSDDKSQMTQKEDEYLDFLTTKILT